MATCERAWVQGFKSVSNRRHARKARIGSVRCHSAAVNGVYTRVTSPADGSIANLDGFMSKIKECNSGLEHKSTFVPFVVESELVGYVHESFLNNLMAFENVFEVDEWRGKPSSLTMRGNLQTVEQRTEAMASVLKVLYTRGVFGGWRDELFPVSSQFGAPPKLLIERAAINHFAIKAYGVHINGYIEKKNKKYLWVAKRSQTKSTYPGSLDHIVAGGIPHGISCFQNVIKEAEEEAGIPKEIASQAVPAGAVSYETVVGATMKRDVLFCYDLKLPLDFVPTAVDGEVESFFLLPLEEVAEIIQSSTKYKPNCTLVVIDFLVRHGYISPDKKGYLSLVKSLRSGDCI